MSETVHGEAHRQVTAGWFRAGIFGVSDGLVTNVSLILGFAGANPGHDVVRLAGLAGLVAGGFSMASGEWISMRAQKELLEYEIEVERRSISAHPELEREELRELFVGRGIDADLAARLSEDLMRDPDLALRTHAREELGVDPSATGSPWAAAFSSLIAFCVGAFVPLLPWVVTTSGNVTLWSVLLGAVGALAVGAAIGRFIRRGVWRWSARLLLVATLAAGVTYGIGRLVGA